MATLNLNGYEGYFKWQITDLSAPFNTDEYIEAGITAYPFTVGGVTSISGVVSKTTATASRTLPSTPAVTVDPYTPGTYILYGYTKVLDGTYWPAGSAEVIVAEPVENPTWTLATYAWGTLSETDYASYSFDTYQLKRSSMKFADSGTATFYSVSDLDTIAYLSTTTSYDSSTGEPTNYLASNDDGGSGSNFSITYDVTAGTTYYLWVRLYDGEDTGAVDVYVVPPSSSRPSNWAWYTTVASGAAIGLTAAEWNDFCTKINEFRAYTGLTAYSFTTAVSGVTPISATIVNQARTAISAISGHGTLPSAAVSGGAITAAFFNDLKNALNAVP